MAELPLPFPRSIVEAVVAEHGVSPGSASIREMNRVVNSIEARLGARFIRMEFGIPGLKPHPLALEAEREALVVREHASIYPAFDGVPELKLAAKDFAKSFLDLSVPAACVIPTEGAMHGCFISIGISCFRFRDRDTFLFLDPGFPVNKLQCKVWGVRTESIDLYDHRGPKLLAALEERLATGRVGGIMYSNPNNPAWVCLDESELAGIGALCTKHRVIAVEDLAYFGMDFRKEYGNPGAAPFQPTVARHTDQWILVISSSKIFSYAGQRVAVSIVSPALFEERCPALAARFNTDRLGHAFVHGGIYPTTAGVVASAQFGLAALMNAVVAGQFRFTDPLREYERRARAMKEAFLANGFRLVYDNDLGEPLADGFYFTVAYGDLTGARLLDELLCYGVSAIALAGTGSTRTEGIRACVSLTPLDRIPELHRRLEAFHRDHG
jgi:aspartate/methionine/tyrosine aminotransferase